MCYHLVDAWRASRVAVGCCLLKQSTADWSLSSCCGGICDEQRQDKPDEIVVAAEMDCVVAIEPTLVAECCSQNAFILYTGVANVLIWWPSAAVKLPGVPDDCASVSATPSATIWISSSVELAFVLHMTTHCAWYTGKRKKIYILYFAVFFNFWIQFIVADRGLTFQRSACVGFQNTTKLQCLSSSFRWSDKTH